MKYKIYKHTSPSGKVYIGQTSCSNIIQRWRNGGKGYFRADKYGNYQQPKMVNAINKYPWDTWKHEIIDECDTQEEADLLEKLYIKQYNSIDGNFGYNITEGGGGHSGQPMRQETKDKLSQIIKNKWKNDPEYRQKCLEARKEGFSMHINTKKALLKANLGRVLSDETKNKISIANGHPVLQFSLTGIFIQEYQSASKAAEAIGKTSATIINQCKGNSKKCGEYFFIYKEDYDNNPDLLQERINNLKVRKKSAKPIIQLSLEEDFIREWPSITDASEVLNISKNSIGNCLKKRSNSAGKFKWKYKNDN